MAPFVVADMLKNKCIVSLLVVYLFYVHGASDGTSDCVSDGTDGVSVMEGDSVTLYTNITINQGVGIKWYFNDIRIAQISGNQSKICTDVQCNEGTERFRDRLKLDNTTGSLTIMNTTTEHTGVYQLKFSSSGKIFNVAVYDVPAEREEIKRKTVKEGEAVTLETLVEKHPNNLLTWFFNDTLIVSGDQSKICTDVQSDKRFSERLKLDPFGSLTIMNTRNTDSGEYTLQIIISRFNIFSIQRIRSFSVTVTADPGSGLSPVAIAGICGVVLSGAVAIAVGIYYYCRNSRSDKETIPNVQYGVLEKEKSQDPRDQDEDSIMIEDNE